MAQPEPLRGMFQQQIVDLMVQRRSDGAIVTIIELEDHTRTSGDDTNSDSMLRPAQATSRAWHSKTKPDAAAIRTALLPSPDPAPVSACAAVAATR